MKLSVMLLVGAIAAAAVAASAGAADLPYRVTVSQMVAMPNSPDGEAEGTAPNPTVSSDICYVIGWGHNDQMLSHQWDSWPWDRRVIEWRKTCFNLSRVITYRYSEVHLSTTICSSHDRFKHKVSGGVGFYSVTVQTGAFFDCGSFGVNRSWEDLQNWTCYASELAPCKLSYYAEF